MCGVGSVIDVAGDHLSQHCDDVAAVCLSPSAWSRHRPCPLPGDNKLLAFIVGSSIYCICLQIQNPSPWWRVTLILIYVAKLLKTPCLFLSQRVKKRDLNVCQIEVGPVNG